MKKYIASKILLPCSVFCLASLFIIFEMALQVSPSVMVNDLMRDIGLNASGLGIMASAYFYSYAFMQIPAGLLFDNYNAKKLITFSMLLCICGVLLFGSAQTVYMAALGRFLMGFGSAFAFISVLYIASVWFDTKYFALLSGITQLIAACGAMSGGWPLAIAVERLGWRNTMYMFVIIGLLIATFIWYFVRTPYDNTNLSIIKNSISNFKNNLKMVFSNKQSWIIAFYSFTVWSPIIVFAALWGVPFLGTYYHIDKSVAANACSVIWIGVAVGGVLIGKWSDRLGRRKLPLALCMLLGLTASIGIIYVPNVSMGAMYALLLVLGLSSAGQALSFAVVKDNNHASVTGTAVGFNNMAVVAGGALFQPLVGILLQYHSQSVMVNNMPVYSLADYQYALLALPLCYLAGLGCLLFMRETYCKNQFTHMPEQHKDSNYTYMPVLKAANSGYE